MRLALPHDRAQRLVVRRVEPELTAQLDDLTVDDVDLRPSARREWSSRIEGLAFGIVAANSVTYRTGSSNGNATPLRDADPVRLEHAAEGDGPRLGVRHQLADRHVERRASAR